MGQCLAHSRCPINVLMNKLINRPLELGPTVSRFLLVTCEKAWSRLGVSQHLEGIIHIWPIRFGSWVKFGFPWFCELPLEVWMAWWSKKKLICSTGGELTLSSSHQHPTPKLSLSLDVWPEKYHHTPTPLWEPRFSASFPTWDGGKATAGERKEREGLEGEACWRPWPLGTTECWRRPLSHHAPASSAWKFILCFQCGGLFESTHWLGRSKTWWVSCPGQYDQHKGAQDRTPGEAGDQDKAHPEPCQLPLGAPSHVRHAPLGAQELSNLFAWSHQVPPTRAGRQSRSLDTSYFILSLARHPCGKPRPDLERNLGASTGRGISGFVK